MLKNDDIKINFGLVSFGEIIPNHTKRYILFLRENRPSCFSQLRKRYSKKLFYQMKLSRKEQSENTQNLKQADIRQRDEKALWKT